MQSQKKGWYNICSQNISLGLEILIHNGKIYILIHLVSSKFMDGHV